MAVNWCWNWFSSPLIYLFVRIGQEFQVCPSSERGRKITVRILGRLLLRCLARYRVILLLWWRPWQLSFWKGERKGIRVPRKLNHTSSPLRCRAISTNDSSKYNCERRWITSTWSIFKFWFLFVTGILTLGTFSNTEFTLHWLSVGDIVDFSGFYFMYTAISNCFYSSFCSCIPCGPYR